MADTEYNDMIFEKECSVELIKGSSFDSCTFRDCNLPECDLSGRDFTDCIFENCNLGNIKLNGTGLKQVEFKNCKMTGTDFGSCRDIIFEVLFEDCVMDFCNFYRNNLRKTLFSGCRLTEAEFLECDLREASFKNCDLLRTGFIQCDLSDSDFRTALNYVIDPEKNRIAGAKFSYPGVLGLLEKYDIIVE